VSRLPRHQEHLKTGFTAEAVSAAMYRAFARQAAAAEKPNLERRWLELAEEKDRLAVHLLEEAGKVRAEERNLGDAIAEEQYEIEVLYPRLVGDVEHLGREEAARAFLEVVEAQREHLDQLLALRRELTTARGDVAVAG
jgi:rubrerythrin